MAPNPVITGSASEGVVSLVAFYGVVVGPAIQLVVAAAAIDGRVALANMGGTVLRATAVEQALASGAPVPEAAEQAAEGTSPSSDMHADGDYRRHLARLLTRRALESASSGLSGASRSGRPR